MSTFSLGTNDTDIVVLEWMSRKKIDRSSNEVQQTLPQRTNFSLAPADPVNITSPLRQGSPILSHRVHQTLEGELSLHVSRLRSALSRAISAKNSLGVRLYVTTRFLCAYTCRHSTGSSLTQPCYKSQPNPTDVFILTALPYCHVRQMQMRLKMPGAPIKARTPPPLLDI